jgi:hypothetical protein
VKLIGAVLGALALAIGFVIGPCIFGVDNGGFIIGGSAAVVCGLALARFVGLILDTSVRKMITGLAGVFSTALTGALFVKVGFLAVAVVVGGLLTSIMWRGRRSRAARNTSVRGGLRNPFARMCSRRKRLAVTFNAHRRNLISYLLSSALQQLPEEVRQRWKEEWSEHRRHYNGWRLLWWALCLRATAARTGRECRQVRLPLGRQ